MPDWAEAYKDTHVFGGGRKPSEDFEDAMTWLRIEQQVYQGKKFEELDQTHDNLLAWFEERINMYLNRAITLGLDNPLGRQAAAKATATAVGMLQNIIRVANWIPQPGFPSGELRGDFPKVDEPDHTPVLREYMDEIGDAATLDHPVWKVKPGDYVRVSENTNGANQMYAAFVLRVSHLDGEDVIVNRPGGDGSLVFKKHEVELVA